MGLKADATAATVGALAIDAVASWLLVSDKSNPTAQFAVGTVGLACLVFGAAAYYEDKKKAVALDHEAGVVVERSSCSNNPFVMGHAFGAGFMALMVAALGASMLRAQQVTGQPEHYGWDNTRWLVAGAAISAVHTLMAVGGLVVSRMAQTAANTGNDLEAGLLRDTSSTFDAQGAQRRM